MTVNGLGVINRIAEKGEIIKGVLSFVNEKSKTVDKIGFSINNSKKNMEYLRKIIDSQEMVEIIGKLYVEDRHYYISIMDIKVCRAKYKLFQEVDEPSIETY